MVEIRLGVITRERACSEAAIWWWREIICSSLAGT